MEFTSFIHTTFLFIFIVIIGVIYSLYPGHDSDAFISTLGEFDEPNSLKQWNVSASGYDSSPMNFPGELSTDIDAVSNPLGNPYSPNTQGKEVIVNPVFGKGDLDGVSTWIDTVFKTYTKILASDKKQNISQLRVVSNITYTPTNTPIVQKKMLRNIVKTLLATINIYSKTNIQLVNIDTIQAIHLSDNSVLYKVSFYTHELMNKLSSKCVLELYVEPGHIAHIQAIYTIPANLPHIPLDYKKYIDGVAIHLSPNTQVHPGELSMAIKGQLDRNPVGHGHHFDVNDYEKKLVKRPLIYSADPLVAKKACETAFHSWKRMS